MLPAQDHHHPHSFDVRIVKPADFRQGAASLLDDTPPYTPHSKSLDLLRSEAASPTTPRLSLDTISTLRGHRISSPIFINSSTGVKPLPEPPRQVESSAVHIDELDEEQDDELAPPRPKSRLAAGKNGQTRASTMPRCFANAAALDDAFQPKTPSRRQESSDHLLKSKFSMSPVQPSKWSKARHSQDRNSGNSGNSMRLPEGVLSQDTARSTLGNWSHSLGMAARKLQKSAMPAPTSESYGATLEIPRDVGVTPEKGKSSLRTATSLASIRRFITPSRRTRKVSTTRGLAGSRRAMQTLDDVTVENGPAASRGSEEEGWEDADGRASRAGLSQINVEAMRSPGPSGCEAQIEESTPAAKTQRKGVELPRSEKVALRRRALLPPEFWEASPRSLSLEEESTLGTPPSLEGQVAIAKAPVPNSVAALQLHDSNDAKTSAEQASSPAPAPSKLKTLQLLARQPFTAFGRKFRSIEKSWRSTRSSQDVPRPSDVSTLVDRTDCEPPALLTRRSEDLLSRASPRVCDAATTISKSRSVELDRMQLPSKVIPLRPSAPHKRRPLIPDAFAQPAPPAPTARAPSQQTFKATPSVQAHISQVRHPWMKQLQLAPTVQPLSSEVSPVAESAPRQIWPRMVNDDVQPHKIVPTVSLTAASVALSQPIAPDLSAVLDRGSLRRPPPSLLGQSLPIPPRCGRSRASTISSQSSTTSSPSGKVIVSRRSYGQRLRSPSTQEDTGSIRSVGTSILFTGSPPSSPGMCRLMSPPHVLRSPSAMRVRSPPKTVLLPKYSPHRPRQAASLRRKPSTAFTDDSDMEEAQEWIDEPPPVTPTTYRNDLCALRSRLEETLPHTRPGFLEMNEATHTLSNLVRTFSGSSPSLSLNSSPYKQVDTPNATGGTPRGLYGIMEADEQSMSRSPRTHQLASPLRRRLISIASVVSTEANSSFEDSEELQKLLDSIMAADLGGTSCDTSGSRDMALLSPFGSPEEFRGVRLGDTGGTVEEKGKDTPKQEMPPPPRFLLNDRPISPPDSSCMSDEGTHSNRASLQMGEGGSAGGYASFSVLDQQC